MNQIFNDEVLSISKLLSSSLGKQPQKPNFRFISDGNDFTDYFKEIFKSFDEEQFESEYCFLNLEETAISEESLNNNFVDCNIPVITVFTLNLKKPCYQDLEFKDKILNTLKMSIALQTTNEENRIILFSLLPDLDSWPCSTTHLAEMELSAVLSKADGAGNFLHQLETELENAQLTTNWYSVRFDNLFGPKIADNGFMQLQKLADEAKSVNTIEMEIDSSNFSCTYIRDVLRFFEKCCFSKKYKSGLYNLVSYNIGLLNIISTIYNIYPGLEIALKLNQYQDIEHYNLGCRKIKSYNWKKAVSLREAIYRTFYYNCQLPYGFDENNSLYNGRLDVLRKLELDIVKEIDTICKENDIKYFLVGGSLLGAIRHQGFIPWDDDLDVGMLREDFEKFRRICPAVLSEKYSYQSYRTEPESHYIFDKIRLRNTIFSTAFSNRFQIENGIFVDILVYDKTAKSPLIQKLHIHLIQIMKRVINVRWINKPRKKIHYKATKIFLPIMRLIPFPVYHYFYEKLIKIFNHSKSDFYIDSVGMNLMKGAFPKECIIGEPQYVPFEDTQLPVPPGWDEYLRHWYGDNYMDIPAISSWSSGHNLSQMDLGEYVE